MAHLVYKRISTDQRSTARQDLVLADAGIEDLVAFEEDAGTSSRLHPLQRRRFAALLDYAREGDTIHLSGIFRLVRGKQHILDVLNVLYERRLFTATGGGQGSRLSRGDTPAAHLLGAMTGAGRTVTQQRTITENVVRA